MDFEKSGEFEKDFPAESMPFFSFGVIYGAGYPKLSVSPDRDSSSACLPCVSYGSAARKPKINDIL